MCYKASGQALYGQSQTPGLGCTQEIKASTGGCPSKPYIYLPEFGMCFMHGIFERSLSLLHPSTLHSLHCQRQLSNNQHNIVNQLLHLSHMTHLILYLKSYASRVQKYSSSNLSCYCWATLSLERGRNVSKVTQITNISLTQRKMLVCRIHSSLLALSLRVPT